MATKTADYAKAVKSHSAAKHGGKNFEFEVKNQVQDAAGVVTGYDLCCKQHGDKLCAGPITK